MRRLETDFEAKEEALLAKVQMAQTAKLATKWAAKAQASQVPQFAPRLL